MVQPVSGPAVRCMKDFEALAVRWLRRGAVGQMLGKGAG